MSVPQLTEGGQRWEIKRGLIAPDMAHRAGLQAMQLVHEQPSFVKQHDFSFIKGFEVYGINNDDPESNLYGFQIAPDLIEVCETIARDALGMTGTPAAHNVVAPLDVMFINVYQPGAYLDEHQDDPGNRVAVGLLGAARMAIHDLQADRWHVTDIKPGDGACFYNRDQAMNPKHRVKNISHTLPRLALVMQADD